MLAHHRVEIARGAEAPSRTRVLAALDPALRERDLQARSTRMRRAVLASGFMSLAGVVLGAWRLAAGSQAEAPAGFACVGAGVLAPLVVPGLTYAIGLLGARSRHRAEQAAERGLAQPADPAAHLKDLVRRFNAQGPLTPRGVATALRRLERLRTDEGQRVPGERFAAAFTNLALRAIAVDDVASLERTLQSVLQLVREQACSPGYARQRMALLLALRAGQLPPPLERTQAQEDLWERLLGTLNLGLARLDQIEDGLRRERGPWAAAADLTPVTPLAIPQAAALRAPGAPSPGSSGGSPRDSGWPGTD